MCFLFKIGENYRRFIFKVSFNNMFLFILSTHRLLQFKSTTVFKIFVFCIKIPFADDSMCYIKAKIEEINYVHLSK